MAEKDEQVIEVENEPERTEEPSSSYVKTDFSSFFNQHKKLVTYIGGGILGVIVLLIAARYFYVEPMNEEAKSMLYKNQRHFENDSFNLALFGTGGEPGMQEIADEYSLTKAGNLANYYTGMSLLHEGKFDEAIDYLKDFSSNSIIIQPLALGGIGDAYSQLKDYDNAASYYMKAARKSDNDFTAPYFYKKAGIVYEHLGKYDKAIEVYQKVKDDYSETNEGSEIEKYLSRAQASAQTK